MAYYKQQEGEANEVHRLKPGKRSHGRIAPNGDRYEILPGDTFHPNENEIKVFGDKFEVVLDKPKATFKKKAEKKDPESKPESTPDPENSGNSGDSGDGTGSDGDGSGDQGEGGSDGQDAGNGDSPRYSQPDFSSPEALKSWEDAGRPEMTVPKTGHGGKTWSKKDVDKQVAQNKQ